MAQKTERDGVTANVVSTHQAEAEVSTERIEKKQTSDKKGKFLIVPLFITEPAIGEGAGAGLVYFHGKDDSERPRVANGRSVARTTRHSKPPPTVTGVMGFYTNNETQGVGIGHSSSLIDDRYRLSGVLADAMMKHLAATLSTQPDVQSCSLFISYTKNSPWA